MATWSTAHHDTVVSEGLVEDGGERKERGSEEEDQGRGEVERERAESQVDTPSEELSSLNDKVCDKIVHSTLQCNTDTVSGCGLPEWNQEEDGREATETNTFL